MELLKPKETTQLTGVNIVSIKRWGKTKSVQTAGDHHRAPRRAIERLTARSQPRRLSKIEL
jgi:predicted site-specific integrase-resolvase